MLYTEVVKSKTLELLKELMNDEKLKDFNLVGGTALSLYLGHRRSIDLDLFSRRSFDERNLQAYLTAKYGFKQRFTDTQILKGDIDGVFIDCIKYDYPMVCPVNNLQGIRLTSIPDIIAMKLSAITYSGDREKDFVDVAFFSTKMSLNEMLSWQSKKFNGVSPYSTLKALLYFEDVKKTEPLMLTDGIYKWETIEKRLREMEREPNRVFDTFPVSYSPQETELREKALCNTIAYVQGRKGFPWLRDAFNELCYVSVNMNKIEKKEEKNYKRFMADRLLTLCNSRLNAQQLTALDKDLKRLCEVDFSRGVKY